MYYSSRSYFYQYFTDVNFFRNIYNIGIVFAGLVIYLGVMHVLTKKFITRRMANTSVVYRHLKVTFHRRVYFYFNSIVFYQYLTLVLACCLQFTDLTSSTNQGAFSTLSAIAAILAFVLATLYPLFHFFYLRYKKSSMTELLSIQYANRYHEIFFRIVKRYIWTGEKEISYSEQFYNLYRFGELWWYCVVVTALAFTTTAQIFVLLVLQLLHGFVVLFTGLSRNNVFKVIKALELAGFVGL